MPDSDVIVRMYNVGFGDAFLVLIPAHGEIRKVLFDCGSIKAGEKPIKDIRDRIIADVTDSDGVPRLDVVVGTHRHKDHVSGFDSAVWRQVEVKEVWMPWTEDPRDDEAKRIRETQSRLAASLVSSFAAKLTSTATPSATDLYQRYHELALNALSNEGAMRTLHGGFAGRPPRRFFPSKTAEENTFETEALPGVKIFVMGPSRDKEVIRDMDPPAGKSYLRLLGLAQSGNVVVPDPFNVNWAVEPSEFLAHYGPAVQPVADEDRERIRSIDSDFEQAVAVSLDKAVNGTSLMLMLQIGEAYLLFPGDAQWGTWQAALGNPQWRDLLKRTTFYKIGHHGSHNATPKEFVEETVGNDFWAMASTNSVDQWPNIPRRELFDALRLKTARIARSDREQDAPAADFTVEADFYIEARVPT